MSWFSNLLGGRENTSKVIDIAGDSIKGIGAWIDGKDFTQQEKAANWAKAVEAHLELVKATADENSIRSVTRRWLAWTITGWILSCATLSVVLALLDKHAAVKAIIDVVNAFELGMVFIAVMGFYFGVQLFRK